VRGKRREIEREKEEKAKFEEKNRNVFQDKRVRGRGYVHITLYF